MTTEIFNKNLALLKSLHPNAYEILKNSRPSKQYEVTLSQTGIPTLSYIKPNNSKIYLLSKYDPVQEAKRYIDSLGVGDFTNFIVLGMGLGYQLNELIKTIPKHSKIIVIENDAKLARLTLETNDLNQALSYPGLTFSFPNNIKEITSNLECEKINFSLNGYRIIHQNSLSQVNPKESTEVLTELNKFFQASTVELKTHSAKSKIFSNNIYKNFKNLVTSPGINVLKNSFPNIPVIICSAGPSLDKNIQFLKAKRENFLLISVATGLRPLLKDKISPDFVIAVDPDEITAQFFNLQKKLMDTWLVYDPVIPEVIPTSFTGKRLVYDSSINLAQWIQSHLGQNGSLGNVFSVAHAAYQFAKFIGCSPIIFIGQDLSFQQKRLHSRNSYYFQHKEDLINRLKTMEYWDDLKFQKYSTNMLERRSIFNSPLITTISMDTYSQMFSTKIDDSGKTINATEGGVGLRNTKTIQLREAINKNCATNISREKMEILNSIQFEPPQFNKIAISAKNQFVFFKEMSQQLNRLENEFLKSPFLTEQSKENFVQEMKLTLQYLSNNDEAALLLQGYDFSGFSLWNKRSTDIMRRKDMKSSNDLAEEEFQRDREFFLALKNSVKFNMDVFEDITKTVNSN